jgi:hypothetical protein
VAKTLDDLREHLFATLDALRDKEKPMEIERAKAISEVAAAVIDSAKAEVAYVKAMGLIYMTPFEPSAVRVAASSPSSFSRPRGMRALHRPRHQAPYGCALGRASFRTGQPYSWGLFLSLLTPIVGAFSPIQRGDEHPRKGVAHVHVQFVSERLMGLGDGR